MRPDAKQRARAYILKSAPHAVAGQGGDNATHAVACTLSVDFGLDDADVRELLGEYNRTKCQPAWSERDLERHVRSARRTANSKPGEVGKLLGVDRDDYTGPKQTASSPPNNSARKPAATGATAPPRGSPPASASANGAQRTARTPFFNVRRAGEGAEPRTVRTLRTLAASSFPISPPSSPSNIEESKKEVSGKSEPQSPAPAAKVPSEPSAPPTPASAPRVPAKPTAPAERNDKFCAWNDGRTFRKRYGAREWTRLDTQSEGGAGASGAAATVKPTPVADGSCPECWRFGKAIPLHAGVCPICSAQPGRTNA